MAAIPTCAVRAIINDSVEGVPIEGATVEATLSSYEVYEGIVVPRLVSGKTDAAGICILDLWPNQLGAVESNYAIKVSVPGRKTLKTFAVIPNDTTVDLHTVMELPPYDGLNDGSFIIGEVLAARDAAIAARDVAITKATEAGASAGAAAASATNAGISETNAATSAINAEGSKNLAQAWAIQLGTPVEGGEYSAKYHALAAAASAASIADGPVYSWVGLFGTITLAQARTALSITNVANLAPADYPVSTAQLAALNLKVNSSTYTADMALKADLVDGVVPSSQLPGYVDDVLEFANLAAFPATGVVGKMYVALDTNLVYRWTGTTYIEISPSPGSTDAVPEGAVNKYFTEARVRATVLTGLSLVTGTAIAAADSVLIAFGKLQKQITDLIAAVAGKSDTTTTVTKDNATGAANLPTGTTAQRPANGAGKFRFNSTLGRFEGNNGTTWGSVGGATGGGPDAVFYESDSTVTTSYAITAGRNAMVAGPITISPGAVIDVPAGSTLTIV
jgi:hypothetical protein